MSDTKILQSIVDGQVSIKNELVLLHGEIKEVRAEMNIGFEKVNSRIDNLGKQVGYLEDDTPTIKDYRKLERRVNRIEKSLVTN